MLVTDEDGTCPSLRQRRRDIDLGVIKGFHEHFAGGKRIKTDSVRYDAAALLGKCEEHFRAMARVEQWAIGHAEALAEEREPEAKLATIHAGLESIAEAIAGKHGAGTMGFGIEPDKRPT